MTEEMVAVREILNPLSGEMVRADDMQMVAVSIEMLKDRKRQLDEVIAAFSEAAVEESRRLGTKTINLDGFALLISADQTLVWDVEKLLELRDLGLPEERYAELVKPTVEYRVDARVANQLAKANPDYARVIDAARGYEPRRQYASVKRGG